MKTGRRHSGALRGRGRPVAECGRALVVILLCSLVITARGSQLPSPLSPEDELKTLQLADATLAVELVAAEPAVRAPVALAWDADGRMFVAEMTDYPSGPVSGRIRLLEDRDGDGRYERSTIFATNLAFPNGLMPWKNGLLVTAAPDIWFLADTNGDGVADVREKVLTGFAEGNQQLRVNGLFWGIDNWIYGANGRSDGEARWAGTDVAAQSTEPAAATPSTRTAISIRRHDFRFRPDLRKFEAIAGNSQFGMGHDDWGNRFPVFNNTPIRHVVMEDRYVERNPALAGTDVTPAISPASDGNRVYALTPPALLIPQPVGFFTSACGPSIYRGTALPDSYRGNYFVCEPVQNVVQRRELVPNGSTFLAQYAHTNREFLASTDPWFHGVFTTTGPDGALYIVDFYREWVEHPHWVAPELRDKVDWRRGEEHGRIWRIRAKDRKPSRAPPLSRATEPDLVRSLESDNGWSRDTAQRLLVERNARGAVSALEKLAGRGVKPQSRVQALYTLDGLRGLSPNLAARATEDPHPRVREHGVRLAEEMLTGGWSEASQPRNDLESKLLALSTDSDARVRLQVAATLGQLPDSDDKLAAATRIATRPDLDEWQAAMLLGVAGERPWSLLSRLKPLLRSGSDPQLILLEKLTGLTVKGRNDEAISQLAGWIGEANSLNRLALTRSFIEALPARERAAALGRLGGDKLRAAATATTTNSLASLRLRLASVRLLAATDSRESAGAFLALLNRTAPEPLQLAAVKALLDWNDASLARAALEQWPSCSKAARREMIASGVRHPASAAALLDAVEANRIPAWEIDPLNRQSIEKLPDEPLRQRAATLLQSATSSDREKVLKDYGGATRLAGDRKRGAAIFERACAVCHQMQGVGARVGPDLSGIGQHPRETLLIDILAPSRQVLPDYISYMATTRSGDVFVGVLVNESASSVTLRRANEPDLTLQRADLKELKTENKSLMPDGLEAGTTVQDMADLLEFLRRPDRKLFLGEAAQK